MGMRRSLTRMKILCLSIVIFCVGYILIYNPLRNPIFKRRHATHDTTIIWNDKTMVWAILAKNNSWALDILLDSLHGTGVILVAHEMQFSGLKDGLRKHTIDPLYLPHDCYTAKKLSKLCVKTNWIWLMRQAWSLYPDVVCFSTENIALHQHAIPFILENFANEFSGVKLSSQKLASPWCFDQNVWLWIEGEIDNFCSLEEYGWEKSIAHLHTNSTRNTVLVPTQDLAMEVTCDNACSEKQRTLSLETIAAFNDSDRNSVQPTVSAWSNDVSQAQNTLMPDHATWTENVHCRGKVCERFQFHQTTDSHVYSNSWMDKTVDLSFITDMGPVCVDMSKISVSKGGEKVEDVLNRPEMEEFPRYERGAFEVYETLSLTNAKFYQHDVIASATLGKHYPLKYHVPGTTLAYTRYDYANVCFAINDLFNIYIVLQHIPSKQMLWLDGHALGNLDHLTSDLFGMNVTRVGHLSGTTCFERLVMVPKKYLLYYAKKSTNCDVNDFVENMWKKIDIVPSSEKHDTVMVRDYYLGHPRVTKEVTRKFSDQDLLNIKRKLPNAAFVRFQELSWKEQLQIIANTNTLYGMHGAGLTLGLFLDEGSSMVEWIHPSRSSTLTFPNLMTWRPDVKFKRMYLGEWLKSEV